MAQFTNPLNNLRIAAPCPADWNQMAGTDRVRFCDQCKLNVYNLSSMTRGEAERLVAQAEGRLCVRFYRRADGSVLTDNCPVGLRLIKRRLSRMAGAVASLVLSFFGALGISAGVAQQNGGGRSAPQPLTGAVAPQIVLSPQPSPPHSAVNANRRSNRDAN